MALFITATPPPHNISPADKKNPAPRNQSVAPDQSPPSIYEAERRWEASPYPPFPRRCKRYIPRQSKNTFGLQRNSAYVALGLRRTIPFRWPWGGGGRLARRGVGRCGCGLRRLPGFRRTIGRRDDLAQDLGRPKSLHVAYFDFNSIQHFRYDIAVEMRHRAGDSAKRLRLPCLHIPYPKIEADNLAPTGKIDIQFEAETSQA